MESIAVIGLGQMGSTLARLLLEAGMRVHVWNRSPERAQAQAAAGALVAGSAAQAIHAAGTVVMCVHDDRAIADVLAADGVGEALRGKVLVQLTTTSPEQARDAAALVATYGGSYLAGAIQVAPDQMGQPDTTILFSGDPAAYERLRPVLAAFGGNPAYLGDDPGSASTMDLATLSYIYGAAAGFFQGAVLAEREGLDVRAYADITQAMAPSFAAFLRHEAEAIATGDFGITQSPLSISVAATRRIEEAMRARGLNTALPALLARLLDQAAQAGYDREEFAAMVKLLRQGDATGHIAMGTRLS